MPKKTVDVQVTTVDAVLEFSIEVGPIAECGLAALCQTFCYLLLLPSGQVHRQTIV